jgi:hypothetical protein
MNIPKASQKRKRKREKEENGKDIFFDANTQNRLMGVLLLNCSHYFRWSLASRDTNNKKKI